MKTTKFECDPLAPRAMLALQNHRDIYPNGRPTYTGNKGRSHDSPYPNLGYVIYETKTQIVVNEITTNKY